MKEAVQKFVQEFRPLEIHYSRGKDRKRVYLSLSISKMFRLYNDQAPPGMSVTHSFFKKSLPYVLILVLVHQDMMYAQHASNLMNK